MPRTQWAETAFTHLEYGQAVEVTPRGYSMRGKINDGETIMLEPCRSQDLMVGDAVLARIQGRR